nr:MAG TPA: hypothetical protein [Caudoviricetes sp.]
MKTTTTQKSFWKQSKSRGTKTHLLRKLRCQIMIKTKEEMLAELKAYIGDRTDDETVSLVENVTDTLSDMEKNGNSEARVKEVEDMWRTKYMERFFDGDKEEKIIKVDEEETEENSKAEEIKIEDLYTEKESD